MGYGQYATVLSSVGIIPCRVQTDIDNVLEIAHQYGVRHDDLCSVVTPHTSHHRSTEVGKRQAAGQQQHRSQYTVTDTSAQRKRQNARTEGK